MNGTGSGCGASPLSLELFTLKGVSENISGVDAGINTQQANSEKAILFAVTVTQSVFNPQTTSAIQYDLKHTPFKYVLIHNRYLGHEEVRRERRPG